MKNDIRLFHFDLLLAQRAFRLSGDPIPSALTELLKVVSKVSTCALKKGEAVEFSDTRPR